MSSDLIYQAIKELRQELTRLDQIIKSLEGVVSGKPRRGRPPKFLAEVAGLEQTLPRKAKAKSPRSAKTPKA